MTKSTRHCVVLVTVPNVKVARKIARAVLEQQVAACANVIPGLESHYWWKGKITTDKELLIMMKTTRSRLGELEAVVLANHPYDTPEVVVIALDSGNRRYLDWLDASVRVLGGA